MRRDIVAYAGSIALGFAALALTVGCRDDGSGAGAGDGSSGGDSDGDGGSGDDESGGEPGACEVAPGRVGLQRLTRAEYNRTVRDLFGVTSAPANSFPPDSATGGFDNNAASLTVSPQLASLLLDAAETVAIEAITNDDGEILSCDPATATDCAETILSALALRVYRRPPSAAELADLLALVAFAEGEGETFEASIQYALQGMLVAPQFLYRSIPPDGVAPLQSGEVAALDDYAIATRLSYLLWGSTPDDALLARAGQGSLTDPDALREEFDRLLADDKAYALYDGFFSQWLQLGKLGLATPNPETYPEFDEDLRDAMAQETRDFFGSLRERDGSPLEIINGTQTFANAALADIYGVAGVTGTSLSPIETDPTQRAGVLTMPAVLAMTSSADASNIVKRGVWLAEAILCEAPPPPPAGVPAEPELLPGETERERLARHRQDPQCASCHNLIDPLGFPFEGYGVLGQWRETVDGEPVDDLGTLPDGTEFNGVVELAGLLAERDDYKQCVSQKLMTFALGRTVGPDDLCVIEQIGTNSVTADSGLSDLLWAVVTSDAFASEEGE